VVEPPKSTIGLHRSAENVCTSSSAPVSSLIIVPSQDSSDNALMIIPPPRFMTPF
jgi:hypothetical protein